MFGWTLNQSTDGARNFVYRNGMMSILMVNYFGMTVTIVGKCFSVFKTKNNKKTTAIYYAFNKQTEHLYILPYTQSSVLHFCDFCIINNFLFGLNLDY